MPSMSAPLIVRPAWSLRHTLGLAKRLTSSYWRALFPSISSLSGLGDKERMQRLVDVDRTQNMGVFSPHRGCLGEGFACKSSLEIKIKSRCE